MRRFILQQLAAVVVALSALAVVDQLFVAIFPAHPPVESLGGPISRYMADWALPEAEALFARAIEKSGQIVLFGSSELSSSYGNEPFRFFPERRGVPLLAVGGGGAQSLTILTVLLRHQEKIGPQSRVVVMLSPWWFLNPGSEAGAFRRFTPASALSKIYFDRDLAAEHKRPLEVFAREKMHQINPPPLELILYRYAFLRTPFVEELVRFARVTLPEFVRRHSRIYQDRWPQQFVFDETVKSAGTVDWPSELAELKKKNLEHSLTNAYGFADSSWPDFRATVPRELKAPASVATELQDLEVLAQFLRSRQVPALFIMQPLNALAYQKLERFDSVKRDVAEIFVKNQMSYVDFLSRPYERELLIDLAHPSSYGWARMNLEIENWLRGLK